jgi:uncharacterized protein YkwD
MQARTPHRIRRQALCLLIAVVVPALGAATSPAALAGTPTRTEQALRADLLLQITAERHAHHLAALRSNPDLDLSARRHTVLMDADRTLSHQLPGERSLGARVSATGYAWTALGENIGWTSDTTARGVAALQSAMYRERPPNDGHRRNILSTLYRQIGVGVVYDARQHRVWITEDFGRPA